MEIGSPVRLIQPVVQGEIVDTEYDKGSKSLRHLVAWTDADGNAQQRWFDAAQLEDAA